MDQRLPSPRTEMSSRRKRRPPPPPGTPDFSATPGGPTTPDTPYTVASSTYRRGSRIRSEASITHTERNTLLEQLEKKEEDLRLSAELGQMLLEANNKITAELKESQEELVEVKSENASLSKSQTGLRKRIEEYQHENVKVTMQCQQAEQKYSQLKKRCSDIEERFQKLMNEHEELKVQNEELTQELETAKQQQEESSLRGDPEESLRPSNKSGWAMPPDMEDSFMSVRSASNARSPLPRFGVSPLASGGLEGIPDDVSAGGQTSETCSDDTSSEEDVIAPLSDMDLGVDSRRRQSMRSMGSARRITSSLSDVDKLLSMRTRAEKAENESKQLRTERQKLKMLNEELRRQQNEQKRVVNNLRELVANYKQKAEEKQLARKPSVPSISEYLLGEQRQRARVRKEKNLLQDENKQLRRVVTVWKTLTRGPLPRACATLVKEMRLLHSGDVTPTRLDALCEVLLTLQTSPFRSPNTLSREHSSSSSLIPQQDIRPESVHRPPSGASGLFPLLGGSEISEEDLAGILLDQMNLVKLVSLLRLVDNRDARSRTNSLPKSASKTPVKKMEDELLIDPVLGTAMDAVVEDSSDDSDESDESVHGMGTDDEDDDSFSFTSTSKKRKRSNSTDMEKLQKLMEPLDGKEEFNGWEALADEPVEEVDEFDLEFKGSLEATEGTPAAFHRVASFLRVACGALSAQWSRTLAIACSLCGRRPILQAPWTPNAVQKCCSFCRRDFGLFVRRHHCRFCGELFCARCSAYRFDFSLFQTDAATTEAVEFGGVERVCASCYTVLRISVS